MDHSLTTYLPLASLVIAALALWFSLLAAFPGLKNVFAMVRDGILWLALFFVLGGATFIAISSAEKRLQHSESAPQPSRHTQSR